MEKYNLEACTGIHRIKITIQDGEFKGHIFKTIGGNCKGKSIIESGTDYFETTCEDEIEENDCSLKYEYDTDTWYCTLTGPNGELLSTENISDEMNDMVVAVEIISYEQD